MRFELIVMTSNENLKSHFISSIASKWVSSFSEHTWFWLTSNENCLGGKSTINVRWSWNSTRYYIDSNIRSKWRWWRIRTILIKWLTIIGPIRNSVKTERPQWNSERTLFLTNKSCQWNSHLEKWLYWRFKINFF